MEYILVLLATIFFIFIVLLTLIMKIMLRQDKIKSTKVIKNVITGDKR